jgi:flagellar biogenesis protein FliO
MDLMRQSFAITLVFLLLWVCLWWLKRRGIATLGGRLRQPDGRRDLELLQRLNLTPQHSLQLVRIKDRSLLVAVHPAGVTVLRETESDSK